MKIDINISVLVAAILGYEIDPHMYTSSQTNENVKLDKDGTVHYSFTQSFTPIKGYQPLKIPPKKKGKSDDDAEE